MDAQYFAPMKTLFTPLFLAFFCFSVASFAQGQSQKEMSLYGNIDFGIGKREFYRLMPEPKVQIGDFTYNVKPEFYKDSVITSLTFSSDILPADSFKRVEASMHNLSAAFTRQFGKPALTNKSISPARLFKGRFMIFTFWHVGNKYLAITMYRTKEDQYYVTCKIENKAFEKNMIDALTVKKDE